jgi:hypothetical protein
VASSSRNAGQCIWQEIDDIDCSCRNVNQHLQEETPLQNSNWYFENGELVCRDIIDSFSQNLGAAAPEPRVAQFSRPLNISVRVITAKNMNSQRYT